MGWCHEFGVVVCEGCSAPMVAGASSCSCPECGTVCEGRFAGCPDVWAVGPRPVTVRAPVTDQRPVEAAPATLVASLLAEEPTPAPVAPPAVAPSRAVGEVLAWMIGAIDDLRSELQHVAEAVATRGDAPVAELRSALAAQAARDAAIRDALAELPARLADELAARLPVPHGEAADATARIVALAENLPSRLGVAIAAAIEGRQDAYLDRVDRVTAGLEATLADVRATLVEVRPGVTAPPA